MKLNYKRTILVGFAFFLISAFWQAYDAIIPLILTNHFGLSQFWSGVVSATDNVLAVFLLPVFGAISDKVMSRYGKRTPFVFVGTILAVITFICLALVDSAQLPAVLEGGFAEMYAEADGMRKAAYELMAEARRAESPELIAAAEAALKAADKRFEAITNMTFEVTAANALPLIGFIGMLLLVLISMAIFRSPAVALMPDVTVKPLRSKGNAIINLMGTAGGIIVLVLGMIFAVDDIYKSYTGYVIAVGALMLVALGIFLFTVKENKWAEEMRADTEKYGIEEKTVEAPAEKRKLSRDELISLMLILASVALWYIGYNSITSKYSVYATRELGFSFQFTLIVAQAAAVVAYIPVGIIASKIGRKKTILAGITMLAAAFLLGHFIDPTTSQLVMYPVFVLAGIGWATINVNSFPMVVELAKGGDVGKYTGYYYTASMSAQIIAPILSGALYDLLGMRNVFFVFGTIFVAASFVTMFFVKHGDAKPEKVSALESLAGDND